MKNLTLKQSIMSIAGGLFIGGMLTEILVTSANGGPLALIGILLLFVPTLASIITYRLIAGHFQNKVN